MTDRDLGGELGDGRGVQTCFAAFRRDTSGSAYDVARIRTRRSRLWVYSAESTRTYHLCNIRLRAGKLKSFFCFPSCDGEKFLLDASFARFLLCVKHSSLLYQPNRERQSVHLETFISKFAIMGFLDFANKAGLACKSEV